MLNIPAEYDRDISQAKLKGISCQIPTSLLGVSAATRDLRWTNWELLELRWGRTLKNGSSTWDALYDATP